MVLHNMTSPGFPAVAAGCNWRSLRARRQALTFIPCVQGLRRMVLFGYASDAKTLQQNPLVAQVRLASIQCWL